VPNAAKTRTTTENPPQIVSKHDPDEQRQDRLPDRQPDASPRADMTLDEAKKRTQEIRHDLASLGEKLLDLYERRAWRVLGYGSWGTYCKKEFERTAAWAYQQLEAARMRNELSTLVDTSALKERQARELTNLLPKERSGSWRGSRSAAASARSRRARLD
jgi:hypothetical protein